MIGSKINEIRLLKNISLSQLSRDTGISKGYLSNIENGIKENPSIDILRKIAAALNVNIGIFYEGIFDFIEDDDIKLIMYKSLKLSNQDRKRLLKLIDILLD